jgi:ActR/RegA family two-component response regulator
LSGNEINILIVDGDAHFRTNLGSELKNHGYKVSMATCGNKAFELFPQMPFQVVVADIHTANGNGLDIVRSFSAKNIKVPVILTSGERKLTTEAAKKLGAADFLYKPLNARDLMEKVRRVRGLPTSFSYFINQRRTLTVVSWLGELRATDTDTIKRCLEETMANPVKYVVLNLHGFTGYDTVLAGEIVAFQQKIRGSGSWLVLCGLEFTVREKLASKGLVVEGEIQGSLQNALQYVLEVGMK